MPAKNTTVNHHNFDIPVELWIPGEDNAESAARPSLLLLHDAMGPDDFLRAAGARLAESGYVVALPDLFARRGGPSGDSEVARQDFLFTLSDCEVISDILAVTGFLSSHKAVDRKALGVLGWGWGGAFALTAAAHDPRIRAVVDVGGEITYPSHSQNHTGSPLNFVADIEGAIFAAFAENDVQPPGEIARLRERLIEHDKIHEVKVFSGTTGRFWRDDTPPAALLWRRIEQFIANAFTLPSEAEFADGGYANEASRLHA